MPKGMGSVFQQQYGDGKHALTWTIEFKGPDGNTVRESSHSRKRSDAVALLKKRNQEVQDGTYRPRTSETFETLCEKIRGHYIANNQDIKTLNKVLKRLERHGWTGKNFSDFTEESINAYKIRRAATAARSTVNREVSALTKMCSLAQHRLHVPRLREDNARQGFFSEDQFEKVVTRLPLPLRPVARAAYITGWRTKAELLTRQWKHVDKDAQMLVLDSQNSKNKEQRLFPIIGELAAILEAQRYQTDCVEKERKIIVPWVFHRNGKKISRFDKAWHAACEAAGCPGMQPHDFRRTAVRNMVRSGLDEKRAMKLTGHKTRSVFDRYNIVREDDLRDAAAKYLGSK